MSVSRKDIILEFVSHKKPKDIDMKKYNNFFVGFEFEYANNDDNKYCECDDDSSCDYCEQISNNGFWVDEKYAKQMATQFDVKYHGHDKTNGIIYDNKQIKKEIPVSFYNKLKNDSKLKTDPSYEVIPIQNATRNITFTVEQKRNLYDERQLVTDFYTDGSMPYEAVTMPVSLNSLPIVKKKVFDVILSSGGNINMYLSGRGGLHMTYLINSPHDKESQFDEDVLVNIKKFATFFYPNLIELFALSCTRKLRYRCIPHKMSGIFTEKYECVNMRRIQRKTMRKAITKSEEQQLIFESIEKRKQESVDYQSNKMEVSRLRQKELGYTNYKLMMEHNLLTGGDITKPPKQDTSPKIKEKLEQARKKKLKIYTQLKLEAINECEREGFIGEFEETVFWAIEVRIPDGTNDWNLVELQAKFYSALIRQIALYSKYGQFRFDESYIDKFNKVISCGYTDQHINNMFKWDGLQSTFRANIHLMMNLLKPSLKYYGIYDEVMAKVSGKKLKKIIKDDVVDVTDYINMKCQGLNGSTLQKQFTPKTMTKKKIYEVLQ